MTSPLKACRQEIVAGRVSPIVDRASAQQNSEKSSKKVFISAAINCIVACFFMYEWNFRLLRCWFDVDYAALEVVLPICALLLALSAGLGFVRAATFSVARDTVVLSPVQSKLMGMKRTDPNYNSTSPPPTLRTSMASPQETFSLLNMTLTHSTPVSSYPARASPSPSPSSSFHTTQASPMVESFIGGDSRLSKSAGFDGGSIMDSPSLRHRRSPFLNSPLPLDDFMTDQKRLNSYLKAQFESSQAKMQLLGFDATSGGNTCVGPTSIHSNDAIADLAKNVYQLSTRSPKSPARNKDSKDDVTKHASTEYWTRAGVDEDDLTEWVARLRRWISTTILRGIVREVDAVNGRLKQLGCPDVQVGESSLHALKQVRSSKGSQVPALTWLLPYLEVTSHQEYVVERIRGLATGYMSEFSWDKGGKTKERRDWGDDLITDCELIMHVICVYMDFHLPANPRFPDGKTFSSQHFLRTPDKPKPGRGLVIHQSALHPPHYQVILGETTYSPPSGRHNMFVAILLFLHYVKTNEASMLGQVNLGLSGINILHVVEPVSNPFNDVSRPMKT